MRVRVINSLGNDAAKTMKVNREPLAVCLFASSRKERPALLAEDIRESIAHLDIGDSNGERKTI